MSNLKIVKLAMISLVSIYANDVYGNGFFVVNEGIMAGVSGPGIAIPIDEVGSPMPIYEKQKIRLEQLPNEKIITWQTNNRRYIMDHEGEISIIPGQGEEELVRNLIREPNTKISLDNLFLMKLKKKLDTINELKQFVYSSEICKRYIDFLD